MKAFEHLMYAHGVKHYRACATSAMRDAENGAELVELIKEKSGIDIEVISGMEEASIIFATHIEDILNHETNYLYIDVGGGSTELTFFADGQSTVSRSFNIGTIRLLNSLVEEDDWSDMKSWVQEHAADLDGVEAIGSGGNINRLYKMNLKNNWEPLLSSELFETAAVIEGMSYEDRLIELHMNPDRADVVVHATQIFKRLVTWGGIEKINVPKMGLADGMIRQMHQGSIVA